MSEACSMRGDMRNMYKILAGRKRLHERPRRRWEDNVKMDFRETVFVGVD
jgi:hypothetical protein